MSLDVACLLTPSTAASSVEVVELLDQVSSADAESFPAVGVGTDVRIDSREIAGAALVRDDQVVHLSAFRKRITRRQGHRTEA